MGVKTEKNNEPKSILLGEDDAFISEIYQVKLEREGYRFRSAKNGEELLMLARKERPDLILLDLLMPIKDGFETLAELKADDKTKDVKVIVLTNLSQKEDQERAMALGAADYAVKADIDFKEVLAMIKKQT